MGSVRRRPHFRVEANEFPLRRRFATTLILGSIYFRNEASMRTFTPPIEHISVQSLKPYPRNAWRHSKAQIKQIAASIERFGFNNPVLIADDGEIVAGH